MEKKQTVVASDALTKDQIRELAVKSRSPSLTALKKAQRSAHTEGVYAAFSMLFPV